MRNIVLVAFGALLVASGGASAQSAPPVPPTIGVATAPPRGRTVMIPTPVLMRDMTPAEEQAHMLWSLRAALNVAALQCQFSPFLATVRNYNDLLRHHSAELDTGRKAITAHFTRHDKAGAQKQFDQYTTRTYNSFSTLDAQLPFCEKAAEIGRAALTLPKGGLTSFAAIRLPEIRASLIPQPDPLTVVDQLWMPVPMLDNPCLDKKGRRKKKCK